MGNKRQLTVGDRVTVYGGTERTPFDAKLVGQAGPYDRCSAFRWGCRGTVKTELWESLTVTLDRGGEVQVHTKQCRRLVKRKAKK